jgi:hypothetical protein
MHQHGWPRALLERLCDVVGDGHHEAQHVVDKDFMIGIARHTVVRPRVVPYGGWFF